MTITFSHFNFKHLLVDGDSDLFLIITFCYRFEKEYTLTITVRDGEGERSGSLTKCVGDVIDSNGELQYDIYKPLVMNLHNSLAGGKKKE